MKIRLGPFSGMAPRVSPRLLSDNQSQTANNVQFYKGTLRPINTSLNVAATLKGGTVKSLHLFASQYWFNWLDVVNVVRGPIENDTSERTYWTGDTADGGKPKMGYSPYSIGSAPYPSAYYRLGVPVPAAAPSLALGGGGGCAEENKASRAYLYTYVSAIGEEGPPSPPTVISGVCPGQTVNITGMSAGPAGPYNIAYKRIYRSVTGSNNDYDYLMVDEIPVANDTYADSITDANLSTVSLVSTNWSPPPDGLTGLKELSNGMMAGFVGKDIHICEPYMPHAWPHTQTVSYNVVAIGAFGTTMVALTEGTPYIAQGTDPTALSLERMAFEQSCVSARGVVTAGDSGIIYPSPDGLVFIGVGGARVITEDVMRREEWQTYKPESIHGYFHDGQYIGFYDTGTTTGGLIFDPRTNDFCLFDTYATAGHVDVKTDALYLVVSGQLVKWKGGNSKTTGTWKSKTFETGWTNFSVCRVEAATYSSLILKLYVDSVLKLTKTVTSNAPFRLPSGYKGRVAEIEITTTDETHWVEVANSIEELS